MQIEETALPGVLILTPRRFADARGWFCETYNEDALAAQGFTTRFVQDNHSFSAAPGTLRGLHYQRPPKAQAKLVRCARGVIFDVAVDFRAGSPHFGRWVGVELSGENGRQLFIPAGFLHGFVTRSAGAEVLYKCSAPYAPECDGAIRWDDPDIGVDWGLSAPPVLSDKDAKAPLLRDTASPFTGGLA